MADVTKSLTRGLTISVYPGTSQRQGLIETTKMLAEHARQTEGEPRALYAIAARLCAHAAVEGIINEWLLHSDRARYERLVVKQRAKGLVDLAQNTLPMIGGAVPADLSALSTHKNALSHPQPEDDRSRAVGAWLFGDGAQRALDVVLDVDRQFFPSGQRAPIR